MPYTNAVTKQASADIASAFAYDEGCVAALKKLALYKEASVAAQLAGQTLAGGAIGAGLGRHLEDDPDLKNEAMLRGALYGGGTMLGSGALRAALPSSVPANMVSGGLQGYGWSQAANAEDPARWTAVGMGGGLGGGALRNIAKKGPHQYKAELAGEILGAGGTNALINALEDPEEKAERKAELEQHIRSQSQG